MLEFQLKDLLQAVGPTASLIFAAWIFLSFLQSRYTSAYERYRSLLQEFRTHEAKDRRRETLQDQILEYKRRCEQMKTATNIGVIAVTDVDSVCQSFLASWTSCALTFAFTAPNRASTNCVAEAISASEYVLANAGIMACSAGKSS
jgi:hypothetical protein